MSQTEIRLDDLLARNIAVEWFEGVALIQAACRLIRDRGDDADGFPTPGDILLRADGEVSVLRVARGESGVAAAARLLADMARDTLPIQLRLLVSQATATEAGPSQMGEFSKALAFFERPDSRQILQQLYARASFATPRVDEWAPEPSVRDDREKSERPGAEKSAARKTTKKKNPALVAVVAAGLVVASAGAWFVIARDGAARVKAGVGTVQDMIRARFGGTSTAAAAPAVERPEAKRGSAQRPGRTTGVSSAGRRVSPAVDRRVAPRSTMLLPAVARDAVPPVNPPAATEGRPVEYATVEVFAEVAREPLPLELRSDLLYNAQDPGVIPPKAVYPQLPTAPSTVRSDQTVIELIVTADGLVERARLRNVPRNVIEIMLLSAAKAWRFQPAQVDGVPVRFLHRVVIAPEFLSRGSF
jgi:hypothetical protein